MLGIDLSANLVDLIPLRDLTISACTACGDFSGLTFAPDLSPLKVLLIFLLDIHIFISHSHKRSFALASVIHKDKLLTKG